MKPGEFILAEDPVCCHSGRRTVTLKVTNTGSRPVQVGSHFHFFEVNRALKFNRSETIGMRLNIPAGTAVRFEPGEEKEVTLVAIAGLRTVYGLNNLTQGSVIDRKIECLRRAEELGFKGVEQE